MCTCKLRYGQLHVKYKYFLGAIDLYFNANTEALNRNQMDNSIKKFAMFKRSYVGDKSAQIVK